MAAAGREIINHVVQWTFRPRALWPCPIRSQRLEPPLTRWQKLRLVIKVVELRLRFVALMAITGLVFAYWDTIWNRYDKYMRPAAPVHTAAFGLRVLLPDAPARRTRRARQLPDLRHDAGRSVKRGKSQSCPRV